MKSNINTWLSVEQPRLHGGGLVAFIVAGNLLCALAMDMYTPALPTMITYFNTTTQTLNFTIVIFMVIQPISLLFSGPLSDKYGRRPLLLIGSVFFAAGSLACAFAGSVLQLIIFRGVEALGSGCMAAMATAIVKDAFVAEKREMVLSVVTVMFVVGPVAAPILGALVVTFVSWRIVFLILGICGVACLVLSLLFVETLSEDEKSNESILSNFGHMGHVLKDKGFTLFLLVICMPNIPFTVYIASASYIYIDTFNLASFQYSLFFAASAFVSCLGPILWLKVQKFLSARRFITVVFICILVCGVLLVFFGDLSPFAFWLMFVFISLGHSAMRPLSTNVLLSQHDGDTGAASSVINCSHAVFGMMGSGLMGLQWASFTGAIGVTAIAATFVSLALWAWLLRGNAKLVIIKE